MNKVQIRVIGISENNVASEFLLLLLGETTGDRKFPILIGKAEANAISMKLHAIESPRPLMYDVMLDCAKQMDIQLQETLIYRIEKEVFCTKLIWQKPTGETFETDVRISDGVAMAIYADCPIYAVDNIFDELCDQLVSNIKTVEKKAIQDLNDSELSRFLQKCLDNEDYERAAKIRDEIEHRKIQ